MSGCFYSSHVSTYLCVICKQGEGVDHHHIAEEDHAQIPVREEQHRRARDLSAPEEVYFLPESNEVFEEHDHCRKDIRTWFNWRAEARQDAPIPASSQYESIVLSGPLGLGIYWAPRPAGDTMHAYRLVKAEMSAEVSSWDAIVVRNLDI